MADGLTLDASTVTTAAVLPLSVVNSISKGGAVGVGVHDSPYVPRFEAFLWYGRRQHYAIEFVDNHGDSQSLGYAVTKRGVVFPRSMIQTVRTDHALPADDVNAPSMTYFIAVRRTDLAADFTVGDGAQRLDQEFRIRHREAQGTEKRRLTAVVGMRGIQQIIDDLARFNDGKISVWKPLFGSRNHG